MSNGILKHLNGTTSDTRVIKPLGNMVLIRKIERRSTVQVVRFDDHGNPTTKTKDEASLVTIEQISDEYEKPVNFQVGDTVIVNTLGAPMELFGLDKELFLTHASAILGTVNDP